jgi:hypothetical protein
LSFQFYFSFFNVALDSWILRCLNYCQRQSVKKLSFISSNIKFLAKHKRIYHKIANATACYYSYSTFSYLYSILSIVFCHFLFLHQYYHNAKWIYSASNPNFFWICKLCKGTTHSQLVNKLHFFNSNKNHFFRAFVLFIEWNLIILSKYVCQYL